MQIPLDAFDFLTALRSALSSLPVWGSDAKALATMLSTSTRRGPDRDVASELSVKPHNRLFGAGEDGQAKDSYCSPDYSKCFWLIGKQNPIKASCFGSSASFRCSDVSQLPKSQSPIDLGIQLVPTLVGCGEMARGSKTRKTLFITRSKDATGGPRHPY